MPLFSVIVPTFNRSELLERALQSVWRQRFDDFEVIVVDDGSTDGTLDYLRSLSGPVRVLTQENKGPGTARNFGVKSALGDYVAFLDSDDVWFPWTLQAFAELIQCHKAPAILSSHLVEFSQDDELAEVKETPVKGHHFTDYFTSHRAGYFVGAGMAVLRREDLLRTGGFTEKRINAEDHDLVLRMGAAPGFVQIRQPITLGWRRHEGSATRNVRQSYEGTAYLIGQERRGAYAGGSTRARERRLILTRHIRPVSLECVRHGMRKEAWELYRASFFWHARLGRWKYLAGFPLQALLPGR
jgi:GT2 family glycosyltransferase